jgi:flagellar assembly protein FliH
MSIRLPALNLTQPLTGVRISPSASNDSGTDELPQARARKESAAAYRRGWEEGQEALNDKLIAQRAELVSLQKGVFESLRGAVPQVVRDTEQALASLALELAEKLVSGLPITSDMMEAAVKEAVSSVEEATELHVYLHADDLALLKEIDSELLTSGSHPPHFHFHVAPGITRGGCLVKTQFGILDASRENKVALLKEAILT